jgi:glutathione synthase
MANLRSFHAQYGDVIFKPLDGMGGSAIFRARQDDPNVSVILETLTQSGNQTIMAQQYLPAINDGDKRILMINGEAVPWCLARVPLAGESRGNLAAVRARSVDCGANRAHTKSARSVFCGSRHHWRLPHRD